MKISDSSFFYIFFLKIYILLLKNIRMNKKRQPEIILAV